MFVCNIKEFKKKTNKKIILCLDCGKKRVGIAISDENHGISMPMKTIERNNEFNSKILHIIFEYNVGGIVIGLPINENKKINKMIQFIKDISKNLDLFLDNKDCNIPIVFWDESFSSLEAETISEQFFTNRKAQKKKLDQFAAKVILEDFINNNYN